MNPMQSPNTGVGKKLCPQQAKPDKVAAQGRYKITATGKVHILNEGARNIFWEDLFRCGLVVSDKDISTSDPATCRNCIRAMEAEYSQ